MSIAGRLLFRALLRPLLTGCVPLLIFFLFAAAYPARGQGDAPTPSPDQQETPTPASGMAMPAATFEPGSILLPPEYATKPQAEVGAELYRLICQDCHGDRGQGLTGEWRATWHPKDQNCWQSKCHGLNHPDDGFFLPYYIPAIAGQAALQRFQTAEDLYQYTLTAMPWHEPGRLNPREAWQITIHMLSLNDLGEESKDLAVDSAAAFPLRPTPAAPQPVAVQPTMVPPTALTGEDTPAGPERSITGNTWLLLAVPLGVLAVFVGLVLRLRKKG